MVYNFTDISGNDPDSWLWDFGNGATSTEANPAVNFGEPGAYEVCLTASSICGSNQTCQIIEVNCAAPVAGFSLNADELNLSFQDVSLSDPTSWLWTFGDGTTSNMQAPNHTYAEPGVYEVCLEVSSLCGAGEVCQDITVTCFAPQANFNTELDELNAEFTDLSSNEPTTWSWDFGMVIPRQNKALYIPMQSGRIHRLLGSFKCLWRYRTM